MADSKVVDLAELVSPADDDVLYVVGNPGGTPVDRKVKVVSLRAGLVPLSALDTDGTLAGNSDARVATQKAVKTYADQLIAAANAMVFKGVIDASTNPNYPAADAGHLYRISVAGKIGGASGVNVEVGDIILCLADGTPAGTQAAVGASWNVSQANVDGGVIGPASATDSHVALFDGTTGKLIKDGFDFDTRVATTALLKSLADAAGDIIIATGNDTFIRKAVGATRQQALIAAPGETDKTLWGNPTALGVAYTRPSAALHETYPRGQGGANAVVLVSGRLYLFAIALPKGLPVTSISFLSGTTNALATGTNQWFGLFDSSRVALRLTNDDGATAWGTNTVKTLNLTSSFTTTYEGLHYLGIMVAATTVPNLAASSSLTSLNGLAPVLAGFADTGLTAPPGLPFTAAAMTVIALTPYGYLS